MTPAQNKAKSTTNSGNVYAIQVIEPVKGHRPGASRYNAAVTPAFKYKDDGEPISALTDDDLYEEIMKCGVPLLDIIEAQARGYQLGNPIAALGKALAVAACDQPSAVVGVGIGGKPTPLNLMEALVARSGQGKGLTLEAPMACANPHGGYRQKTPASGEALVGEFFEEVPAADGKGTETVRHYEPIWSSWGEIDTLEAKAQHQGATLDSTLRSLWSGERVGDISIGRKKSGIGMELEAFTYRSVLMVGAQFKRLKAVIGDETSGTLQRYLFLPIGDDDAPVTYKDIIAQRHRLDRLLGITRKEHDIAPIIDVWGPGAGISVAPHIKEYLVEHRGAVLRTEQEIGDLDTHVNNNRLRVAALFAGWVAGQGNHATVDSAAWYWAGCLMEVSRRLRDSARHGAEVQKHDDTVDAGKSDALRQMSRREHEIRLELEDIESLRPDIIKAASKHFRTGDTRGATGGDMKPHIRAKARPRFAKHFKNDPAMLDDLVTQGDFTLNMDGLKKRYIPNQKHLSHPDGFAD